MGAANFGRTNASKIFTVLMPQEENFCECLGCNEKHFDYDEDYIKQGEVCPNCGSLEVSYDTEYVHSEREEIDELFSDISSELDEISSSYKSGGGYRDGETFLASVSSSKSYGDVEIHVELDCHAEHGYHEGAKLDWELSIHIEGSEYDEIDLSNLKKEFEYFYLSGFSTILSNKAFAWIEKTKVELIEKVEKVYEKYSGVKLELIGVASNGESYYKQID